MIVIISVFPLVYSHSCFFTTVGRGLLVFISLAQRWLWLIVVDILTSTLHFDPTLLRGYLFGRIKAAEDDLSARGGDDDAPLAAASAAVSLQSSTGYGNGGGVAGQGIMHSLMRVVTTRDSDIDAGLVQQCAELMRLLLDADSIRVGERETFLRHVFETHLRPLVAVLQVQTAMVVV